MVVNPSLTRLPLMPAPASEAATVQRSFAAAKVHSQQTEAILKHGAERWARLHRRALVMEGQDDTIWIAAFGASLPCGDCKSHWLEMLKRTPPDRSRYFAWSVDRHNEVNARIGKPILTEAAARSLWNEPGDAIATPQQAP